MISVASYKNIFFLVIFPLLAFANFAGRSERSRDPWELWNGGHLRGASIWQRRDYYLDGQEVESNVGPHYEQKEFDELARQGANLINISHPGFLRENAPYIVDESAIQNLDELVAKATQSHLYVLISIRTGPGRTEEGFSTGIFDPNNHKVWTDSKAQDAWVEMWKLIATRYRNHPNVIGYCLMVEPNSNQVLFKIEDPKEFYPKYENTLYDWNPLAQRLSKAVREVDAQKPIVVGGMGWSDLDWLPVLKPTGDKRTVYLVHQWTPYEYTNISDEAWNDYPNEEFNQNWIRNTLKVITDYKVKAAAPVVIGEYGVFRWQKGAQSFLKDEMQIFEEMGLSSMIWIWESLDSNGGNDAFDYRKGTDPNNHKDIPNNPLMQVISSYWSKNK